MKTKTAFSLKRTMLRGPLNWLASRLPQPEIEHCQQLLTTMNPGTLGSEHTIAGRPSIEPSAKASS